MDTRIKLGHVSHPIIVTEEYVDKLTKVYEPDFDKKHGDYIKYDSKETALILGE